MIRFFSENVKNVFSKNDTTYDEFKNLMIDTVNKKEVGISHREAEEKIRTLFREVVGNPDINDRKAVRRALRDHNKDINDILEDVIDSTVETGLQASEWFNTLVDSRSIGLADEKRFYVPRDAYLSVARVGSAHHDHALQHIGGGTYITVATQRYSVAVGLEYWRYIVGQSDLSELVSKIDEAYVRRIQEEVFGELSKAATNLPVKSTKFVSSGALNETSKPAFDEMISFVSYANNGADVTIAGTEIGLAKLLALPNANYIADSQKEAVASTGLLGQYNGHKFMKIQNRFTDKTFTKTVFDDNTLMILPNIGEEGKFIKFVDAGDTEIVEKTNTGDYSNDIVTNEVQRNFGVASVISRQFGIWTLA